jgi:hypothetical protein
VSTTDRPQNFANHKRRLPPIYVIAGVVVLVETGHRAWIAARDPGFWNLWAVLVCGALGVALYLLRTNAQRVQDRVIRLEMRVRLERVLGAARRAEIERLSVRQLVALRFASDAELPELVADVLAGKLATSREIKLRVKDWQADWLRV